MFSKLGAARKYGREKKKKREAFCLPTTRFSPIFSFVRYFHAAPLITERLKEGIFAVTLPLISIRSLLNTSDLFYGNSSQLFSVSFCIFTMDDYGKPDMRMFRRCQETHQSPFGYLVKHRV